MRVSECEVLVVGAGPGGLTAAALLAGLGVDVLVAERRPGPTTHPKARGINVRSMEIVRHLGLQDAVRAAGKPLAAGTRMLFAASLVAPENRATPQDDVVSDTAVARVSPCRNTQCAQDELEPLLTGAARAERADLLYDATVDAIVVDDGGAVATVRDPDGVLTEVRARYVIAADGARAGIRTALGIAMSGQHTFSHYQGLYVRADLADVVRGREFALCVLLNPQVDGAVVAVNNTDRWILNLEYDPDTTDPAQLNGPRAVELFRLAAGIPDLEVEVLDAAPWTAAVGIADRFRAGPVFLLGDAAHVLPPAGGFGMNTAIQDAHNLAWKLAWVLRGTAGEALLDTYEQERLPAARLLAAQTTREMRAPDWDSDITEHGGHDPLTLITGIRYRSSAIPADPGNPEGPGQDPDVALPDGSAGLRVPHLWLAAGVSTLDQLGPDLTLFTPAGSVPRWRRAAKSLAVPILVQPLPDHDTHPSDGDAAPAMGIGSTGAVLVRPDGYVAWRARSTADAPGLAGAVADLSHNAGRSGYR